MLGSNVPAKGGVLGAIESAKQLNCECCQIYLTNSRRWSLEPKFSNSADVLRKIHDSNVKIVSHVPFLVNLASPCEDLWKKSLDRLRSEIEIAHMLKIDRIVLHPGSFTSSNKKSGVGRIIDGIDAVSGLLNEYGVYLLLETMSGAGTEIGSTFDELAWIIDEVKDNCCVGVCFDTCHVYVSGYDISQEIKYTSIMSEFDRVLGKSRIRAFHLNNTKENLLSKRDRHCRLSSGNIDIDTFRCIVDSEDFKGVPKLLEPASSDKDYFSQMQFLLSLRQ